MGQGYNVLLQTETNIVGPFLALLVEVRPAGGQTKELRACLQTVTLYSLTAAPLACWLGVAQLHPQGVLLVGAHAWAQAIARALQTAGYRVLLVDTNRANIAAARLARTAYLLWQYPGARHPGAPGSQWNRPVAGVDLER